jgi:hypothetical protein
MSESPIKFGLVYVGSDDGNVQVTKDGGYSFSVLNKGLQKGADEHHRQAMVKPSVGKCGRPKFKHIEW